MQRCPECGEGRIVRCRWKQKNGVWRTVYQCSEDFAVWADEFCRETTVDAGEFIRHEEIVEYERVGEADFEISREDYYGWAEQETAEIICPYCRTHKLIHGITKQTKREIYECPRCSTIWIGSVCPEHVSNYRKYTEDGLRIPDDTEYDRGGLKWPVPDGIQKTDQFCPRCISHSRNPIYTGTVRKYGRKIYICHGCFYVWEQDVQRDNGIFYGAFLRGEQLKQEAAALQAQIAAQPEQDNPAAFLELANLHFRAANCVRDAELERCVTASASALEQIERHLTYGQRSEMWEQVQKQYRDLAALCCSRQCQAAAGQMYRKAIACFEWVCPKMIKDTFWEYERCCKYNPPDAPRCIDTLLSTLERMLAVTERECTMRGSGYAPLRDACQEFSRYYDETADYLLQQSCADAANRCRTQAAALRHRAQELGSLC